MGRATAMIINTNNRRFRKCPPRPALDIINYLPDSGRGIYCGCGYDTFTPIMIASINPQIEIVMYDPNISRYSNQNLLDQKYNFALSFYVANILPPTQRVKHFKILNKISDLIFIAVHSTGSGSYYTTLKNHNAKPFKDGFLKFNGKFQKYYSNQDFMYETKKYFDLQLVINSAQYILGIGDKKMNAKMPIRCKKYGVGKQMINRIYIHKEYESAFKNIGWYKYRLPRSFKYDIVRLDEKEKSFAFIECRDFNTSPEPAIGKSFLIKEDGSCKITNPPQDPWIYHHKWLMVAEDYKGFDVEKSRMRSKYWLSLPNIDFKRIGKKSFWEKNVIPLL